MKEKKILSVTIAIMVIIAIAVFLAGNIKFYMFDTSVENVGISLVKNSKSNVNGQLIWFTYDNGDIELNYNMLFKPENIKIYALSHDNTVSTMKEGSIKINENMSGSFIACVPKLELDYNSDGSKEAVYSFAKTDTIATQGFEVVNTQFNNEDIPFEIVLKDRRTLVAYFNKQELVNASFTMNSIKGENIKVSTDSQGIIKGVSLKEIRNGVNFTYIDREGTYYVMSYQVEDNTLFGARYIEALQPFSRVVIISCVIAIILCIIRSTKGVSTRKREFKFRDTWANVTDIFYGIGEKIKNFKLDFMGIRWIIMILSFTLLTFGAQIFGGWLSHVYLPVLSCPQNQDQAVQSACYSFSHLDYLFGVHSIVEILVFLVCFILSVILLGRVICGFICPFGLMQDVVHEIRQILKIRGMSFNEKIYGVIKLIKWEMLILFLGVWALGVDFCNFCPAIIFSPAFAGFKISIYLSGFIAIIIIVLSFFKRRLWCNICPVGYMIGLFQKFSIFRLKKNCQSCTECGACYEACPMGIKSIYTERENEDITTSDCIMCGECVKKCPENDAISIAVKNKKIYTASRFKFFK